MQNLPDTKALDKKSIGRRIKCLILQQYRNITHFSTRSGIPLPTIYKITEGEVTPSPRNLAILSNRLGCSVDFLLGVSTPESESIEGYEAALLNVCEFRSDWSQAQTLFLIFCALNILTPKEEEKLKIRLGLKRGS